MTKEEIYKYIKYNGVYDSGVKKRLKQLIKKYHPDRNNGDDTVMKIINEVKKELESGNVSVKDTSITKDKTINKNSVDVLSITGLIKKLNKEINSLNKKIIEGYKDEYKLFMEYNSSMNLYNTLKLNEKLIKAKVIRLKKVRWIDKLNIFLVIISLILMINNIYFSIMLISIIYLEIILILIRYMKIKKYNSDLIEIEKMDREYKEFNKSIKAEIDVLNKDLFNAKNDVRKRKENVRYYEKKLNEDDGNVVDKNKVR